MIVEPDVASNLAAVQDRIDAAARAVDRDPAAVTLVAVGKTKPAEAIRPVLAAGHRVFGENRVQEAEDKWPALKAAFPDARLHLIGPLQTNKVRAAVAVCDVIQSLDRPKLARHLARAFEESGRRLDCFVQINTGEEPQKAGLLPDAADAFLRDCREVYDLPVRGLMCIPPIDEEPALHFALLRAIAERNGLPELSMGMSDDFERAIRLGATHVRVGTAIFGSRPPVIPRP